MDFSRLSLTMAALLSLGLAGCQSGSNSLPPPTPLPPVPAGKVTGTKLPPPTSPTLQGSQFPAPPSTETATASPATAEPPATAPDLTAGSVAGVWTASVSGQSCKVATPQTKFGAGYRAGPLRCPAPIDGVKSWSVDGKQLTLHDADGNVLARLYSSTPEKFDGQTESGVPISLSR